MNKPTGMNTYTANHFNRIAAEMYAYPYNGGGQNLSSAQGQFRQHPQTPAGAFASNPFQAGAPRFGIDPVIGHDIGGFTKRFIRNLMS
jgi:hypothetical protein